MGAPLNATANWGGVQTNPTPKSRKGFASMDPERQRQIASEGGKAAHRNGKAHEWNSQTAAEAGRKRHAKQRAANMGSDL